MVYSTALLERSWLDFRSQYGRERAVLQLQVGREGGREGGKKEGREGRRKGGRERRVGAREERKEGS
jgi:hypothetical protein